MSRTALILTVLCSVPATFYAASVFFIELDTVSTHDRSRQEPRDLARRSLCAASDRLLRSYDLLQ